MPRNGGAAAALLIAAVLASPLWLLLANKLGKYRAWALYNFANVVSNALLFIPGEGQNLALICIAAVNGIPIGGQFLVSSVLSDIIDYDEFLYGVRNEGIFSVYATLIPKFVAIPASAVPLAVLNLLGFKEPVDGTTQQQSEAVTQYVKMMFILFPLLCYLVGLFIKLFLFPIKSPKTHEAIREGILQQQRSDGEVQDPITGALIKPMRLDEEEEDVAYLLENFSAALLRRVAEEKDCNIAVKEMRRQINKGAAATAVLGIGTAVTAALLLEDQVWSIVPVSMVVLMGFSLCYLVVAVLRFQAARSLRKHMQDILVLVIAKVLDYKACRGSAVSRVSCQSSSFIVRFLPPMLKRRQVAPIPLSSLATFEQKSSKDGYTTAVGP
uniref:Uncharacterized protein n=1 Tax=Tetraselmis sp. GSL018 TaxID=582737 RepID=A0A061RIR5_9CHLO